MVSWSSGDYCEVWPTPSDFSNDIPAEPLDILQQAAGCLNQPRASVVTSAAAVDSLLKGRGLIEGSLWDRINKAVTQHLLTPEMAQWAHDVRLDANDQRHADAKATPPTIDDAKRCLEFAKAIAEILYVLPAKVTRGLASAKSASEPNRGVAA